jgi:peptidoglycan-associated lipoprotein
LARDPSYSGTAYKKGYYHKDFEIGPEDTVSDGPISVQVDMEEVELDEVVRIPNIYYAFDKATLNSDAVEELEKLVKFLKINPRVRIRLSSHTDSRGSRAYNQDLSRRRAENVVRYLKHEGIDGSRIRAKGYGEERLVNECSDGVECSEEEHRKNRRTEMKVTAAPKNAMKIDK